MITLTPRSLVSSLVLVWFSFCWNSIWGAGDSQDYYNQAPLSPIRPALWRPGSSAARAWHTRAPAPGWTPRSQAPCPHRSCHSRFRSDMSVMFGKWSCTCFPAAASIYPQLLMVWLFDWGHSPTWFWSACIYEWNESWLVSSFWENHLSQFIFLVIPPQNLIFHLLCPENRLLCKSKKWPNETCSNSAELLKTLPRNFLKLGVCF